MLSQVSTDIDDKASQANLAWPSLSAYRCNEY